MKRDLGKQKWPLTEKFHISVCVHTQVNQERGGGQHDRGNHRVVWLLSVTAFSKTLATKVTHSFQT